MSPRNFATAAPASVSDAVRRLWISLGTQLRDTRRDKNLTVAETAQRACVSTDLIYAIEAGRGASTEALLRVASALSRRLEFKLIDPRHRANDRRDLAADAVHSAMGELEAAHLRRLGFNVGVDEPYQHYQFAGRADLVAWTAERTPAFLHIENRTRFPDFQDMAGSYNAKRAYLGPAIAARLGIGRWQSETHVIAALWSSEAVHALRLRTESFRSLCSDSPVALEQWWRGEPPERGTSSTLIVLDPLATSRQRQFVNLEQALTARPRHRGYGAVAQQMAGMASS